MTRKKERTLVGFCFHLFLQQALSNDLLFTCSQGGFLCSFLSTEQPSKFISQQVASRGENGIDLPWGHTSFTLGFTKFLFFFPGSFRSRVVSWIYSYFTGLRNEGWLPPLPNNKLNQNVDLWLPVVVNYRAWICTAMVCLRRVHILKWSSFLMYMKRGESWSGVGGGSLPGLQILNKGIEFPVYVLKISLPYFPALSLTL